MPSTTGRKLPFATRDMTTNAPIQPISKKLKADLGYKHEVQAKALNRLKEIRAANGGNQKCGDIQMVVDEYSTTIFAKMVTYRKLRYQWEKHVNGTITINNHDNNNDDDDNKENEEETNNESTNDNNNTNNNNTVRTPNILVAGDYNNILTIVTGLYKEQYLLYNDKNQRVPKGTFQEIINRVTEEHGYLTKQIDFRVVWNRINVNNITGIHTQRLSPIHEKEPDIADMIEALADCDRPISKREIIALAGDMICASIYKEQMMDYKEKRKIQEENFQLGVGWYRGFCIRFKDQLQRYRAKHKDFKRHTFVTTENFQNMYDYIYNSMVESGVAKKLDHPIMYDVNGLETLEKEEMVGRPTHYCLTHPEMVLFVDETGCNTNQKDGKYKDGRLYMRGKKNKGSGIQCATTDIPFTTLCFTAATGEAVMCAIILKSAKDANDLPFTNTRGIDTSKRMIPHDDLVEVHRLNSGPNGALAGGPKCFFQNQEIPTFVCSSPKASITSDLLCDMLKTMDSYHLFDRSNGKKPFLLADGHGSRFGWALINYAVKSNTPWTICFGVSYGTHIWQVHDSNKMNGAFKSKLKDAKDELTDRRGEDKFFSTDVVPLVKTCFASTFGNVVNAKKAIRERGWNPLNYACMDHIELKEKEIEVEQTATNNNVTPQRQELDYENDTVYRPSHEKYTDILCYEAGKSEARKKKWLARKQQRDDDVEGYKSIMKMNRLTSGQMVANNKFSSTDPEVHAFLVRQRKEKRDKQNAIGKIQYEIEKKNQKAWIVAYRKWDSEDEDEKLVKKDYEAIFKKILVDGDVMPKKVADLKKMFETPKYQDRMGLMACEVPDSDEESVESDDSTCFTTDDPLEICNNGETSLTELDGFEDLQPTFQSELNQDLPGEEQEDDCNSVATVVLLQRIRNPHSYSECNMSRTVQSTTPIDCNEDEDDCISESTVDIVRKIRYKEVDISHNVASETDNVLAHDTNRQEMSESDVVRVLAGMRSG